MKDVEIIILEKVIGKTVEINKNEIMDVSIVFILIFIINYNSHFTVYSKILLKNYLVKLEFIYHNKL